ncbi:Rho GTPase-activating protein 15 [Nymphon striatum]|nr:Rho GTPase-activating protein 15 [Nymphon striatum]
MSMTENDNEVILARVLYDFEYQVNDSRWIWMKEGEKLIVLKQVNKDWWQVRRHSEKIPFYAPATYLETYDHDDTTESSSQSERKESLSGEHLDSGIADVSGLNLNDDQGASSSDCNIDELSVDNEYLKAEDDDNLSSATYHNPIYSNFEFPTIKVDTVPSDNSKKDTSEFEMSSKPDPEMNKNESSPIYANFPVNTMTTEDPPVPTPKQVPLKILLNHWAEYVDDQSRKFYYNSVTEQGSWKPPRKRLDKSLASPNKADLEDTSKTSPSHPTSESLPVIIKRATVFYDELPHDTSLSVVNQQHSKNKLNVKEKPKNKSDSQLNKETSTSSDKLDVDKRMHVWKSSPSLMRKFKMSIRSSPLLSRRKVMNNNDDKECACTSESKEISDNSLKKPNISTDNLAKEKISSNDSVPEGWTKNRNSSGDKIYFIHEETGEKVSTVTFDIDYDNEVFYPDIMWESSVDESGRDYYYQVNGTESFWKLPTLKHKETRDVKTNLDSKSKPIVSDQKKRSVMTKNFSSLERDTKSKSLIVSSVSENDVKSVAMQDCDAASDGKSITLPRNLVPSAFKQPWVDIKNIIKEGQLNKTKVMESGRRKRKDWSTSHVVLTASRLIFFKDMKSPTSKNAPPIKPEMNIELCGSEVDWCPEKSSRKNVFQIHTVLDVLILFQDDNASLINEWYGEIKKVVAKLPTASSNDHTLKSASSLESDINNFNKSMKMPRSKSSKFSSRNIDQPENMSTNSAEKKKIKKKLKHFFMKRPTMETLTEKGILQDEPVFGCNIIHLCSREGTTIPRFVQECIGAIEQRDMKTDGLYRVGGNLSQIQKIRFQVNQDIFTGVHMEVDIYVLCGCLKMFFRHMKEPLIPATIYAQLLAAIKLRTRNEKMKAITPALFCLPQVNFETLKFLLQHLLRVTQYSHENRMHVQNLAIVFGPTIMGADSESADLVVDMMHQNQIFEFILLEFEAIYGAAL